MDGSTTLLTSRQPNDLDAMAAQLSVEANVVTRRIPPRGSSNIPYSYLQLLSRISLHSQPAQNPSRSKMEKPRHDSVINLLLQQPTEIRNLILNSLDSRDLLTMRATSRTLHDLIHESSTPLCLSFYEHNSRIHHLPLTPLNTPNLSAFFRMSSRYKSACEVATIIALRIAQYLSTRATRDDNAALEIWRRKVISRLERRLKRSLIILQIYLNFMLDNMNENEGNLEPLDDDEYTGLHNIFLFDEQSFLQRNMPMLTETDFIDVTAALEILKLMCKGRCVPFRMKSPAHPFTSVRHILMVKGLAPFTELLAKDVSLAQQEALLRRLSRNIGQSRRSHSASNVASPCSSLNALDGYWQSRDICFDLKRSNSARDRFISHQDIWDKSARAFMMPRLERAPKTQAATVWIQKLCVEGDEKARESDILIGDWDQPDTR